MAASAAPASIRSASPFMMCCAALQGRAYSMVGWGGVGRAQAWPSSLWGVRGGVCGVWGGTQAPKHAIAAGT